MDFDGVQSTLSPNAVQSTLSPNAVQSTLSPNAVQSTLSPNVVQSTLSPNATCTSDRDVYDTALLVIYCVVLLTGTISLSLMIHIMKSASTSITSIAVLNLIFTHFVFLLTVPFRIHYYATKEWGFGTSWCKVVSGMIHIHMYMSFIFYVIILITRLRAFYHKAQREASFQRIHALAVSAAVWMVVLVMVPCIIYFSYGTKTTNLHRNLTECFQFGSDIDSIARVVNYIISIFFMVVTTVLAALQANALRVLYGKHRQGCTDQQDFGAQLKSLCFALIMVVCFIPYHMFRLHYLSDLCLQNVNEVLLSLTTFNCLDMLTFLGRRTWYMCLPGKAI